MANNTASKPELETESVLQAPLSADFLVGNWRVKPMFNRIEEATVTESEFQVARSLEPRLMHLLCYLAANPERVLNRDELVQELWPDVIVNENSLTRAVSELRKQLACMASKSNDYIETIPKKGYRLTALPSPAPARKAPRVKIPESSWRAPLAKPGRLRQQAPLLLTACLSLVLTLWLWQSASIIPSADESLMPVTSARLTDEVIQNDKHWFGGELTLSSTGDADSSFGLEKSVAVSNDERSLAYIQRNNNGTTIFVASVGNLATAYPVFTSNEKLYNLRWSPVGEALLFASRPKMSITALFSTNPDPAKLMMVDINTRKVVTLLGEEPESSATEVMKLT